MWYWHEGIRWWIVSFGILRLLFWAALIGLVTWGVVTLIRRSSSGSIKMEERDALSITRERYARGEISKEQFEQIKKDLS